LLQRAASSSCEAVAVRTRPGLDAGGSLPGYRSPWEFSEALDLVAAFGDAATQQKARMVQEWQYRSSSSPEEDALALYLDVLKKYFGGGPLDEDACARVEAHAGADVASKLDRLFLWPDVRALRAMRSGDGAEWNDALLRLVTAHAQEAMRGEYRFRTIGLMCLPGLRLARFGLDRSMRCTVESPYLPLDLLEARR
jgi:hypothetical protein